jgi:hypothetical protein
MASTVTMELKNLALLRLLLYDPPESRSARASGAGAVFICLGELLPAPETL